MLPTDRMLLVLGVLACCARDASSQSTLPRPVVRDSAGIRIIEYSTLGPEAPPSSARAGNPFESTLRSLPVAFSIESKPYLDIGGARDNEQEELDSSHPMFTAAELGNGTIVVNDKVQLKYFTSGGAFIRAVGRSGSGPGEFRQTREVCRLRGDSVLAVDYSSGRLILWDANGNHLQTFARPGSVQEGSCQADGSVIVTDAAQGITTTSEYADRLVAYRVVRPSGEVVRDLGRLPALALFGIVARSPTVLVVGDQVLVANARAWDVRMQDFNGRVRRITRFGRPPIPVTDKEWEQRTQGTIPRNSPPENTKRIKAMMARKPDTWPAHSRVRVDPAGRIWVQDFESRGSYTVLDSTGTLMGRFVLPGSGVLSRKQLVGVAADHVVVMDEDGDGAIHLRFHRITPVVNLRR